MTDGARSPDAPNGVALVTGAAGRIGRAVSRSLGESGHAVAMIDVDAETLEEQVRALTGAGLVATGVPADISTPGGRGEALNAARALGTLRVLVNNAASFSDPVILDTTDENWTAVLAVNLLAPAMLIRDAVPLMTDGGSVINVSSVRALATMGCGAPYEASKAGILAITRCYAVELRSRGIRVNAISPGTIFDGALREFAPRLEDAQRIAFESAQPSGDIGTPEQIAALVGFLASEESSLINGENIVADGGAVGMYGYVAAVRAAERAARA